MNLSRVLVICGSGNNGGDGIAIARLLHLQDISTDILFVGNKEKMSEGCRQQMEIANSYGLRFVNNPDYSEYTTIVDAIFGIGLTRKITGIYEDVVRSINGTEACIVAVDIPSGISSDDGTILGCAVKSDMTVTFAYPKVGHKIFPGKSYCGKLYIEDIGIYEKNNTFEENYYSLSIEDLQLVPRRKIDGNKGTFGKVLLIAGSPEMPGASILCGQAVMRTGAGMLRIVAPFENREILATSIPEAILDTYDNVDQAVNKIEQAILWSDVVIIGPGLGKSSLANAMVKFVLMNSIQPLVMDADALNIVSEEIDLLYNARCSCIITPHVGEMARLTGLTIDDIKHKFLKNALVYAKSWNVQCVLKDAATCIALPDGTIYVNDTGNSGMATAGSGDVLAGIIGGLLSVGVEWKYAGALGCWIHGSCGDRVRENKGAGYLLASDMIKELSYFRLGEEMD